MIIKKITIGYVVQVFDTDKNKWLSQNFVAGDEVAWEDGVGDPVENVEDMSCYDDYLPFQMEQP